MEEARFAKGNLGMPEEVSPGYMWGESTVPRTWLLFLVKLQPSGRRSSLLGTCFVRHGPISAHLTPRTIGNTQFMTISPFSKWETEAETKRSLVQSTQQRRSDRTLTGPGTGWPQAGLSPPFQGPVITLEAQCETLPVGVD